MPALKDYYVLAKPGIVYGNAITVIGAFLLASARAGFHAGLFFAALIGISLVIGSGCVFNNYIDRDIDAKMVRTKNRALVAGRISGRAALVYGTGLGVVGFFILGQWTNLLTLAIAAVGFFFYVVVYSMWGKRGTVHGTVIGSISGAVPPVVGYCAASGRFDAAAIILFLILVFWQMPHFYAIAIRRAGDYAAAGVPVLPAARGMAATKIAMLLYIAAFVAAEVALFMFGYVGYGYLVVALAVGVAWLVLSTKGFFVAGEAAQKKWARQMFFLSLIVLVILFAAIAVGGVIP